ncbi:hypothetical protein M5689_010613 [Euphorbia peplus]|nr:hypothetical protein M5689_010613 [Euphorbia peplus]
MGLDSNYEPKLSLFSLPNKLTTTTTIAATPPIGALASVPFQWEEAPGKPRHSCNDVVHPKSKVVRCLDLAPRLLNEANSSSSSNSDIMSPSTVLDGPYLDHPFRSRSLSSTGSFRPSLFGSGRWKNKDIGVIDFSNCAVEDDAKVKILRFTRKSSFLGFSSSTSYFLTNIYESFKQVVPWRRRQRNSEK